MTQSGPRNLHEVNLSSSVQVQCLGVETISSKIFKPKLSSDVIQELTQFNVSYLNAGEGMEIHMLIGLNHYWEIIQPDFIRLSCGFVAQNSKFGYIISGACFNNDSTSNMSNVTPSVLCCIASSPPTAGNGGSCKDVDDFWSLESIGVNAPVSTMTDSDTCSNKPNDSNMSIVTPSVFSMTDSGACSNNQNDLCCISSSPPTAGNGMRPCSDVHDFWSLRSRGIDAPVSSMTDSVDLVVEGKSSKTNEYQSYSGALPWKHNEARINNYQGAVLRFKRLKRRLAYTCILFLATVFSMIDSVEIVMEEKSKTGPYLGRTRRQETNHLTIINVSSSGSNI